MLRCSGVFKLTAVALDDLHACGCRRCAAHVSMHNLQAGMVVSVVHSRSMLLVLVHKLTCSGVVLKCQFDLAIAPRICASISAGL